uniref:Uncharacterized protein n=1 Tax=Plectus sambesii TaxID=2011161 RepID=A0A914XL82_9BILA
MSAASRRARRRKHEIAGARTPAVCNRTLDTKASSGRAVSRVQQWHRERKPIAWWTKCAGGSFFWARFTRAAPVASRVTRRRRHPTIDESFTNGDDGDRSGSRRHSPYYSSRKAYDDG